MNRQLKSESFAVALVTGVLMAAFFCLPAAAEFPPEGAVADPDNPSKADKITVNHLGKTTTKSIDHYYFDCLKKKWVWVSRDL